MANKISLTISGVSIVVSTLEEESYVLGLAKTMNENIAVILEKNTSASVTNASLLCAIDYLDSYQKANRSVNNMRSQLKEYLADAANAKLLYDEEKKHSSELATEIQSLRSHLTRIATEEEGSGSAGEKLKSDLETATKELALLREQLRAANELGHDYSQKTKALSDYIAEQEKEVSSLTAKNAEYAKKINEQEGLLAESVSSLKAAVKVHYDSEAEIARLKKELKALEDMVFEDGSSKNAPLASPASFESDLRGGFSAQPPLRGGEPVFNGFGSFGNAPASAQQGDFSQNEFLQKGSSNGSLFSDLQPGDDDLPNLSWTKDL
ncbi:MAG: cell division protein ZapA [Oscillospiraceae bacterium]